MPGADGETMVDFIVPWRIELWIGPLNSTKFHPWMNKHCHDCWLFAAIYLILVFGTKHIMKDRPRFELKPLLILWNISLAILSAVAVYRMIPEWTDAYYNHSFKFTICNSRIYSLPYTGLWAASFMFSKLLEFGDTAFVVLRKQNLIFLHWYHHITVMMFCYYAFAYVAGFGRYFLLLNGTVHFMMYSYYALRAMKIRLPRPVAMFITISQISQMAAGLFVGIMALYYSYSTNDCIQYNDWAIIYMTLGMYGSYLFLFIQFFIASYFSKPSTASTGSSSNTTTYMHKTSKFDVNDNSAAAAALNGKKME